VTQAWEAQHRLHKLYEHLAYGKAPQLVAVARELAGFLLWAIVRVVEPVAS
jgi:hypothetical protein